MLNMSSFSSTYAHFEDDPLGGLEDKARERQKVKDFFRRELSLHFYEIMYVLHGLIRQKTAVKKK